MTSDKGPEQEHFKANYIEVIKRVVPEFYEETEYQLFGAEEDLQYKVLGKILYAAKNISSLVMVPDTSSSWFGAQHLSSIRYVPYFVPYNELSRCTPAKFEKHVLAPLGKTFGDFPNVGEFSSFLLTSALPSTHLNSVTHSFAQNYSSIVDSNKSSVSAVSNELIDQLGWVYLLNTSGQVIDNASVPPSSLVVSSLTEKLFYGQTLTEADGVSNLFKWLYTNCQGGGSAWTEVSKLYLPSPFNSPSSTYADNYYASGSQLVSALDTLVNVWVNDDDPNTLYFKDIVDASLLGLNVRRMENKGPMGKMLKALAYAFYDVQDSIRDIQFLLDIDECPEEFLQYLGRYLGWTFFSEDPDNWRRQLKQAIYLYKAKGTRAALVNATNMVIPSSIYNPTHPVSGLQELWESYIPNLIYYSIKTETDLGKTPAQYQELLSSWQRSFDASSIPIAMENYDPLNGDNNVRFLVDYILKYLDYKHDFLRTGDDENYEKSNYIQNQVSANVPLEDAGYKHRGRIVPVPPWEDDRFYQNSYITSPILLDLSSILVNDIGNVGVGIEESKVSTIARFISSSVSINDKNGFLEPGWGHNNAFKFMSSSLSLPFNYKDVIKSGDLEAMSLFDYWSSKSSSVHSKFNLSSIDFTADNFIDVGKTKLGRRGFPTIIDIFRQFAPFHVINRIFAGSSIVDDYFGTRNGPHGSANAEKPWSGVADIEIINTIQSDSDQVNSSYTASAFPGNNGVYSGISPSIYNPRQGRFIPSSTLYTTNYFMEGGGSGIVSGLPKGFKKAGRAPRTAGRRRSLKYKFTGWSQTRKGLNQPTNTDYFAASSIRQTENRQLFIPGFVPKGFNFSSQQFVDTSGSLSSVYDFNNASGTTFYEFAGSSFFPARAVPDFETNASSFNQLRDVFGSQILRTLTQIFIRRGKEDSRWLRFTNDGFRNFKFGRHVIALYHEYNNKFRRQAQNWVFDSQYVAGNRYSGGFNIVSHVFGPGVFNHNFSHKGKIIDNLSTNAFITSIPQAVSAIHKDWSAIATTVAAGGLNETVIATDGTTRELTEGILQSNAYGTYRNALDIFERPGETYFSNDTLLSGIEILAPAGQNSLAVWNHDDNPSFNVDKISPSGITLIQRSAGSDPRNGIRVRYELGGNKNYSYNGKFEFAPIDYARLDKGLSAIAGWRLVDKNRTPSISQFNRKGVTAAAARQAQLYDKKDFSGFNTVTISCKGKGARTAGTRLYPLGVKENPSIQTVVDHPNLGTPANLRRLTPGRRYRVELQASSGPTARNPKITYALFNATKQKLWDASGQNWTAQDTTLSSNFVSFLTSSTDEAGKTFKTWASDFTVSSTFDPSDKYELWITPVNDNSTQTVFTTQIGNIKTYAIEASSVDTKIHGLVGNKLFPNQDYTLGVTARIADMAAGPVNRQAEYVLARVVVEQKPFVGNGLEENFCKAFAFNWKEKFWKQSGRTDDTDTWMRLDLPADSSEERFELNFNTLNSRTDLRYFSLGENGPYDGYFASAGPVHDDNSVYYIEIAKPERTNDFAGVTVLSVDLLNTNYNIYAQDYTQKNFIDVFDFFDKLNAGKSSRDVVNSSGTYLLSGGSRSEYLEYFGGSHSSVNGEYGFVEND